MVVGVSRPQYETLYRRAHHPAEYYYALLNNQPMGFYPPRVLVGDARRHSAPLPPGHVNQSDGKGAAEDEYSLINSFVPPDAFTACRPACSGSPTAASTSRAKHTVASSETPTSASSTSGCYAK